MKIELFDFYIDRLYCQWWIVIGGVCFYNWRNFNLINIQKDSHRWIIEILFIRIL